MALAIGGSAPSKVYVGSTQATAMYLGSTLIYSAAVSQTTYATENFTNWSQWTAINTAGTSTAASNVGTMSGPTNNSSGATQYQTRRMILSAAGARGDMTAYLEFSAASLQEAYFDIGLGTQNATGLGNPKGVYASFYPGASATEPDFTFTDSDGQYTGSEQKFPFTWVANAWYAMRIRRKGKRVSMKVWNLSGSEPTNYGAWSSQGVVQGATGYLSVGVTNGYNTTAALRLRNVTVKSYIDEAGDTTPFSTTLPTATTVQSSGRNWTLSSSQDYPTNVAEGGFRTAYPNVASYAEEQGDTASSTTGGKYSTTKTVSVVNGILTVNQRIIGGVPYGAMILADNYAPHTYGRAQFRARQTDVGGVGGFKFVPLWWPSSDNWADGEIDWPEANNGDTPRPATASVPPTYIDGDTNRREFYPADTVEADYDTKDWHVYTVDWAPDALSFYQDGSIVMRMTNPNGIPTKPMRFGFQFETWINEGAVPTGAVGKVEVDWVAIYDLA